METVELKGNRLESHFGALEIPSYTPIEGSTFDAFQSTAERIYEGKIDGLQDVNVTVLTMPELMKPCFDLVWTFTGNAQEAVAQTAPIAAYFQQLSTLLIKDDAGYECHYAARTITKETNDGSPPPLRLLLVRIFNDEDWPCTEHPELLLGQPIGTYHCPACGQMQLAGLPHLPKGKAGGQEPEQ